MSNLVKFAQLPDAKRTAALDKALERFSGGDDIHAIAGELKISVSTLCRHLVMDREEQWKAAKRARTLAELEDAEKDLKGAADTFQVNKAAARIKAAQWQLEKLYRTVYGDEGDKGSDRVSITLNIGIQRPGDLNGSGEVVNG